jgi:CRAL/TRIO domain
LRLQELLLVQLRDELLLEIDLAPEWRGERNQSFFKISLSWLQKNLKTNFLFPLFLTLDLECLRRYLRARKHDILKAKEMVLNTLKWRQTVKADTIATDLNFTEKVQFHQHYPEGFFCTDREGSPVYIQQPGNIDTEELWKFTTLDRAIQYHISQQEKYVKKVGPACSIKAGKQRFQSIVIIDMDGVGVSTLTGEVRNIMGRIMAIDQDYYPELMQKALIINAPTTFRVIWSMIKYLLDSRTQSKIEVLPVDYQPELLKYIAPENLMVKYGGKNATPLIEEPGPWNDVEIMKKVEKWHAEIRGEKVAAGDSVDAVSNGNGDAVVANGVEVEA